MVKEPMYRHLSEVERVACPCGWSRRLLTTADEVVMGLHVTELHDAQAHFHERTTEIYYVLEGEGRLVISGSAWDAFSGTVSYIPPGCVHRAEGDLTAVIAVLPPYDPSDELRPSERLPRPCHKPIVRHVDDVTPLRSACGESRRVLTRDDAAAMGLHVVRINKAERHYHARTTEIYYVIDGGGTLQVGDEQFELTPGCVVYVPAGLEHGGEGDFTALVICAPPFDPGDQIVV